MALYDNAVFTAATGYIYTAPIGTLAPAVADVEGFDPSAGLTTTAEDGTTPVTWDNIGHTARDELPVFGYEGGETETRGTWQAATLKVVETEPASDYVTFNVHQFDEDTLALYYGASNTSGTAGVYSVGSTSSGGTDRALTIVIVDGNLKIAFHAPKVTIRREDSIELSVDEFAFMPLRATLVNHQGSSTLFSWVNTFVPAG